jgi:hypothetical protein
MTDALPIVFLDLDETLVCSFEPMTVTYAQAAYDRAMLKPQTPFNDSLRTRSRIRLEQLKSAVRVSSEFMAIVRPDAQKAIDFLGTFAEIHIFTAADAEYAAAVCTAAEFKFKPGEGRIFTLRNPGLDMRWAIHRPWVLLDDTPGFAKITFLEDLDFESRVIQVDPLDLGDECLSLMDYAKEAARRFGFIDPHHRSKLTTQA